MAFNSIRKIASNVQALDESRLINRILSNRDLQEAILDLNRRGQLYEKGINAQGEQLSSIGGNYSPLTMQISLDEGRPKRSNSHIDLHDTGAFYGSFRIIL